VSRKIIKFVTRKNIIDDDIIMKNGKDFVNGIRNQLSNFNPDQVIIKNRLYKITLKIGL
jgi:hypothetical protein